MTRSGWITLIVLTVLISLFFLFYLQVQQNNKEEMLELSPVADSLRGNSNYTDIEGNPIQLSDYIGQKVIVFAWASWCPSCVEQLTLLSDFSVQREDVTVLAINRAESIPIAVSFLEFYNLDTRVQLIMDPTDHFFDSVGGFSMPETVIFNSSGDVAHHERGPITNEKISYVVDNLD